MKDLKKKFREDVTFRRASAIIGLIILAAILFAGVHMHRAVVYERVIQEVCNESYSTAEQELSKLPENYKECGQIRPYIAIREKYATYIGVQCSKILKSLNELDAFQDERLSENYAAFQADVSQKEQEYQQDKQAAAAVEKKIAAIGTVTTESEQVISDAQSAYDALNSEASTLVSLNSRETLRNAHTLLAAAKVSALIDQIGTVTLESNEKIQTAQTAYDALTADEKEAVKNADTLSNAKTKLEELEKKKAEEEQKAADAAASSSNDDFSSLRNSSGNSEPDPDAGSGYSTYYWVQSGKVYHVSPDCPTLARSKNVHSGGTPPAGRRVCKVCS